MFKALRRAAAQTSNPTAFMRLFALRLWNKGRGLKRALEDRRDKKALRGLSIIKNDAYRQFEQDTRDRIRRISSNDALLNFKYIHQINIQINNACIYAAIHTRCPVHVFATPETLETDVVRKLLDELGSIDFSGAIMFSLYNEPMGDTRFYDFCRYARSTCPHAIVFLNTNGVYLNEATLKDVEAAGVGCIFVSAYTAKEYKRFARLAPRVGFCVFPMLLDRRMDIYERDYVLCRKPCHAPFADLCINSRGEVVLCCLDWKFNYVFGNIHAQSLRAIVNSQKMTETYRALSQGNRELDICKRCDFAR